jgi:hypothetical protein
MIDAAVQRDVDGIPKGSHYVLLMWPNYNSTKVCFVYLRISSWGDSE